MLFIDSYDFRRKESLHLLRTLFRMFRIFPLILNVTNTFQNS